MKFQMPRGTQDIKGEEMQKWHYLENIIRQFTYIYDYQEIRTPIFEHTNVFKRGSDSSDMVNKEMYTFQLENSATSLTLRPEGTAGVVRSFVEHKMYGNADLPAKLYYMGPMCRHERPQKGRQRIFNQFGVEVIGAKSPLLDVDTIVLGWSFLQAIGLKDLKVLVNTLGDEESRLAYQNVLKKHFQDDIKHMCLDCKRRYEQNPLRILDCKIDAGNKSILTAPKISQYLNEESQQYFQSVLHGLDALGIPYEVNDQLVRGLDYYTHTVFEIVSESKGMGTQATILAGGRYDGMVSYFGGPSMSGIGWALGMERLIIACDNEGIILANDDGLDIYVLCLSPKVSIQALQITNELRLHGYKTDTDFQNRSFKAQFKTVERKKAKVAIFVGEKDIEQGIVTLKIIATQKQYSFPIEKLIEKVDILFEEDTFEKHTCSCTDTQCNCK